MLFMIEKLYKALYFHRVLC